MGELPTGGGFDGLLDVTQEELGKLGDICHMVSSRYAGKPKDIKIFAKLKDEMETRCHDAGFIVEVAPKSVVLPDGTTVWQPDCAIVGRVDAVEFDPERFAHGAGADGGILL